MKRYVCMTCGQKFRMDGQPHICPNCGSTSIDDETNVQARKTAIRLIREVNEIIPEMEETFEQYIEKRVDVELRMQTLRTYKRRGIVRDEEMPVFDRPKLAERLNERRKQKAQEAENG